MVEGLDVSGESARAYHRALQRRGSFCAVADCRRLPSTGSLHSPAGGRPPLEHPLCEQHLADYNAGIIDNEFIEMSARPTLKDRILHPRVIDLESRREFVDALTSEYQARPSSLRAHLVGPLFLLPRWMTDRRDAVRPYKNADRLLRNLVSDKCQYRSTEFRLVLTLTDRFREKLVCYLNGPDELETLRVDLLQAIDDCWGPRGVERGPDLICFDTGFYQIDYIFPTCVISQSRLNRSTPTQGGWQYTDTELVRRSQLRFDTAFDANYLGQEAEVTKLKAHIGGLAWQ